MRNLNSAIIIIILFANLNKLLFICHYFTLNSLNSCVRKHLVCLQGFHLIYLDKYTSFTLLCLLEIFEIDSRLIILHYLLSTPFLKKIRMKVL